MAATQDIKRFLRMAGKLSVCPYVIAKLLLLLRRNFTTPPMTVDILGGGCGIFHSCCRNRLDAQGGKVGKQLYLDGVVYFQLTPDVTKSDRGYCRVLKLKIVKFSCVYLLTNCLNTQKYLIIKRFLIIKN